MMKSNQPQAEQHPTPHPTSPWTEVFQQASAPAESANGHNGQRHPATAPAQADSTRPTHDALSAIFNQH